MTNERNGRSGNAPGGGPGRGGFGGRGPGGPGGGRFGGGDRGRGRRGEDRGPVGFEGAALEFARAIDKPLLAGDFEAQLPVLEKFLLATRKGGRAHKLDDLAGDSRGKLFTALLRVGRQKPVEDEEKEPRRKQVFATLAEAWRSLGDSERADAAKAEAGDAELAPHLLAHTGEWDKVAALAAFEKRYRDAARAHEEHESWKEAARLYELAGDGVAAVTMLSKLGDREATIEAAKKLPPAQQEEALLGANLGDVLMELLVSQERWEDVGKLYERAEQFADAARAYEKAGRTHKAIRAFGQAGETAEAERLIEAEAKEKLDADDQLGAARVWARFGRPDRAAELSPDPLAKFRWLREAGKEEEARELARAELEKVPESETIGRAAWMARSGDTAAALKIYDEHRQPEDAAVLFEELGDFELAARCFEVAGKTRKAADLFAKAGNEEAAARLRAAEPPAPARAPRGGGGRGRGGRRGPRKPQG